MAKIRNTFTYNYDDQVKKDDYVIGTNSDDFTTKNYKVGDLLELSNQSYYISDDIIPSHTPVAVINNLAYKLDPSNPQHQFAFYGFSTSGASIGDLLRIQVAGDIEIDANGLTYYTHNTSERGVMPAEQFILSNTTYTGISQTALQKLFNSPTNGAFNVKSATTYRFECEFDLSAMSVTSGTFSFGFLGTATFSSLRYRSEAVKAALATASTNQMTTGVAATAQVITAASTSATGTAKISGIIRVNAAGTLIPAFGLSIAAAAVVQPNAFFKIYPIGTNTVISSGNIT